MLCVANHRNGDVTDKNGAYDGFVRPVVQIADFDGRNNDYWHRIQKVQAEIEYKEKHVKTVVSRDICESDDIHPKKKYELAMRIADAFSALEK